jgi:type IV secretion system protein VirB2
MSKTLFMNNRFAKLLPSLLSLVVVFCFFNDVFADNTQQPSGSADPTGIVTIFCNVIDQITGGVGKVISILILISMAIGLFLGKITWGLAIAVMVGMGLLFGASGIVDSIAKGAANDGTDKICDQVKKQ